MLLRYHSQFDGQPFVAKLHGNRVRIGRTDENDIVLNSPFVDALAVELALTGEGWQVRATGLNGCEVNGQKVVAGGTVAWPTETKLSIFPYVFELQQAKRNQAQTVRRYSQEIHELVRAIHLDILQQLHLAGSATDVPQTTEALLHLERSIEASAAFHGIGSNEQTAVALELAGACVRDQILTMLLDRDTEQIKRLWHKQASWSELATAVGDCEEELKRWSMTCMRHLFEGIDANDIAGRVNRIETEYWTLWDQLVTKLPKAYCQYLALRELKKQVKDTLFGFGPLEDLLRMPTITEIMVNASDEIFVEKAGVLQFAGRQFLSDEVTLTVIERIVGRVGRRIDTAQPMVDARLPDGSRVNAIIPPLAVKGPCLTIRKFDTRKLTMPMLVEGRSITPQVVEFLQGCVLARRSILVSGGTGTGKTTLLNCLSHSIPHRERIICIEDTHELQLEHPHVVFAECRDGNSEGRGRIAVRDLLRNALRQRPDRLIIGECRGNEALDMLQAMNTGHDGSMTTIHSNSPADALRRLEVLVRDSGLPADAIRQQIVSAIDIVVQLSRLPDGHRCVTEVAEVVRYEEHLGRIHIRTLFQSCHTGSATTSLVPTGCLPTFAGELVRDGHIRLDLFLQGIPSTAS